MGVMIDGVFHVEDPGPDTTLAGTFERQRSSIRNWITRDGSSGHPARAERYHLFVAWNCPWAHRALLARLFKGLDAIGVSVARPRRTDAGWVFDAEGEYADTLFGATALHEIYARVLGYTGRVTMPVLWDMDAGVAVSNESADIVRMLNDAFEGPDLAPAALRDEIDRWNARIYRDVNNGVYRAGFARTQAAYDSTVAEVFAALDDIEAVLARQEFLCGERFTEADLRLFPTLARFDVAYHYAFKCNIRRLSDYPHLWAYARRIYAMPGVADTVKFNIYKGGYFSPSPLRNPLGIVPAGPEIDWSL
ncbi:MAG: glutathione S-transferase C-terminal domain-containing protein [Pseudomonadota bacterium]